MYKIGWLYNSDKEPTQPNTIPLQQTITNILGLDYTEIKPTINYKIDANPYKGGEIIPLPMWRKCFKPCFPVQKRNERLLLSAREVSPVCSKLSAAFHPGRRLRNGR